jgi:hypothetical protein
MVSDISEISKKVPHMLEGLLNRKVDGITSVRKDEEGWRVTVDMLDRRSIPDTQDLLSTYEVMLGNDMGVTSYRRLYVRRRLDPIIEEEEIA